MRDTAVMEHAQALALVEESIRTPNLVKHCLAVEFIMTALAERLDVGAVEAERWALAGLLHDLDYATTADDPDRHGLVTAEMLAGRVDDDIVHAILAHANKADRVSLMDKALYAADPATGFIVAAALVRPDKDLASVEVRSLLKRWKEKAFAKGASREQMDTCSEIGLTREEFLALSLAAMQRHEADLGF